MDTASRAFVSGGRASGYERFDGVFGRKGCKRDGWGMRDEGWRMGLKGRKERDENEGNEIAEKVEVKNIESADPKNRSERNTEHRKRKLLVNEKEKGRRGELENISRIYPEISSFASK